MVERFFPTFVWPGRLKPFHIFLFEYYWSPPSAHGKHWAKQQSLLLILCVLDTKYSSALPPKLHSDIGFSFDSD